LVIGSHCEMALSSHPNRAMSSDVPSPVTSMFSDSNRATTQFDLPSRSVTPRSNIIRSSRSIAISSSVLLSIVVVVASSAALEVVVVGSVESSPLVQPVMRRRPPIATRNRRRGAEFMKG